MGATHNVCQLDTMACNKLQKTVALLPIERKKLGVSSNQTVSKNFGTPVLMLFLFFECRNQNRWSIIIIALNVFLPSAKNVILF